MQRSQPNYTAVSLPCLRGLKFWLTFCTVWNNISWSCASLDVYIRISYVPLWTILILASLVIFEELLQICFDLQVVEPWPPIRLKSGDQSTTSLAYRMPRDNLGWLYGRIRPFFPREGERLRKGWLNHEQCTWVTILLLFFAASLVNTVGTEAQAMSHVLVPFGILTLSFFLEL